MLKLDRKANLMVPKLARTTDYLTHGTLFVGLGWGRDENNELTDNLKMAINLPFVPTNICNKQWGGLVKEHQFCAGLGSADTCKGN